MPTTTDDIIAARELRRVFGQDQGSCFGVQDASQLRRPHKPNSPTTRSVGRPAPHWVDKHDDPILSMFIENESKQRLAD